MAININITLLLGKVVKTKTFNYELLFLVSGGAFEKSYKAIALPPLSLCLWPADSSGQVDESSAFCSF